MRRERGPAPLSAEQEQLWYFSRLAPDNPVYNEVVTVRMDGALDVPVFRRAFNELVRRHEIWRSTFPVIDGEPVQVVHEAPTYEMPLLDLSDRSSADAEREAIHTIGQVTRRPYEIDRGPMLRPCLVRIDAHHHRLYLAMHHLLLDGFTARRILLPELVAVYRAFLSGRTSPLAEPALQYADYSMRQRTWIDSPEFAARLDRCKRRLAGTPELHLPVDHSRPAEQTFSGGMVPLGLDGAVTAAMLLLSEAAHVTLFDTIAAAFAVLLHRYSAQEEIVFATAADQREHQELESMAGYCATPVVIRADLSGDPTFRELLRRLHDEVTEALDTRIPFERLLRALRVQRQPGANPVFQAFIALEPAAHASDPSWSVEQMDAVMGNELGRSKFDLHIELEEQTDGRLAGRLIYNSDLFTSGTAQRMAGHWHRLLEGLVADPDAHVSGLPLLTEAERFQHLVAWNATAAEYRRDTCLPELIREQVERTPDAVAVTAGEQSLTYRELDERANRLAHRLRGVGVDKGSRVAVCTDRSPDLVVALLAILKAGAAYVPLEPQYPVARMAYIVENCGATILLTQAHLVDRLPRLEHVRVLPMDLDRDTLAAQPRTPPTTTVSSQDLAYVLYTSGSTGKPKGVPIHHGAVVNLLTSLARTPGISANDVALALSTISFDMSLPEIWLPLISGARMVIVPREVAADGRRLGRVIDDCGVTLMHATPTSWQMLVDTGWSGSARLVAVSGGEALSQALARQLMARCFALWNGYGPTEATAYTTFARVQADEPITIGRPISNARVYILDRHAQPVPVGVPGEIHIAGEGVARGYVNAPDLTASHFLDDPFVRGARMYRTGDLGRHRADGSIEHLGRIDDQVKVRGFRVEPGEVEVALLAHPRVVSAVVTARAGSDGHRSLTAYVVADGDAPPAAALRGFLSETLPEHMVPSAFVPIPALPLTASGKVDRQALPTPDGAVHVTGTAARRPQTRLEEQLVRLWARVLQVRDVGVDDNFFDLGGHSLLAVSLLIAVEEQFGVEMTVAAFVEGGATVAAQAAYVAAARREQPARKLLIRAQPKGSRPALIFVLPGREPLFVRHFLSWLGDDQPVVCVVGPAQTGRYFDRSRNIEEQLDARVRAIREEQPHGPYYLAGYSLGGILAYEIAGRLRAAGETVAWLCLLDAESPEAARLQQQAVPNDRDAAFERRGLGKRLQGASQAAWFEARGFLNQSGARALGMAPPRFRAALEVAASRLAKRAALAGGFDMDGALFVALRCRCRPHDAPLQLFTTAEQVALMGSPTLGWSETHQGPIATHEVPGQHLSMIGPPYVAVVARHMAASLRAVQSGGQESAA